MGLQDKIVTKAAENISGQSDKLFKDIIRIQESMHAHLEKILEVQRAAYNLQRAQAKLEELKWKDDEQ